MKSEEEDKISEEPILKSEEHNCAWLKVEEEDRLALEARKQAEEEEHLRTHLDEELRLSSEVEDHECLKAEEEARIPTNIKIRFSKL